MPDDKNLFDFGTGSIDRDQWLRDIDSTQDEFISMYGSAANKHRTTLLRQAFQDLRRRIASGDMLNRTADGQYQFGSALNREDKHMQEAYQRALGFMGKLARTQIKAPTPSEEKKYGTTTLQQNWLKYLNPSGKFNEKAYWAEGDEASRIADIKKFLEREKNGLGAYTSYDGYKDRTDLENRIQAFLDNPTERNLQKLGFDNRNWITMPVITEQQQEQPSTDAQQIATDYQNLQDQRTNDFQRTLLSYENHRGKQNFNFSSYARSPLSTERILNDYILSKNPNLDITNSNIPEAIKNTVAYERGKLRTQYWKDQWSDLDKSLADLGTKWQTLLQENPNMLHTNLYNLLRTYPTTTKDSQGNPVRKHAHNWQKFLTPYGDNSYYINNSFDNNTGRFAVYYPGNNEEAPYIQTLNMQDIEQSNPTMYAQFKDLVNDKVISNYKEGGVIKKFDNGGEFDDFDESVYSKNEWVNNSVNAQPYTTQPSQNSAYETYGSSTMKDADNPTTSEMDTGDWFNLLGPVALDITSMISANFPGYGTVASGITGVGSTLWSAGVDIARGNIGSGIIGGITGLGADLLGLIPGWGMAAKAGKIGGRLTKMARPLMMALQGAGYVQAAQVLTKGLRNGWDSLTYDDWDALAGGMTNIAKGTSAIKRSNRADLERAGITHKQIKYTDDNGEIATNVVPLSEAVDKYNLISKPKGVVTREGLGKARGEQIASRVPLFNVSERKFEKMYNNTPSKDIYPVRRKNAVEDKEGNWVGYTTRNNLEWGTPNWLGSFTKEGVKKRYDAFMKKQPVVEEKLGGVLKALRSGGIIKAVKGVKLSTNAGTWYNDVFSGYGDTIINRLKSLEGNDRQQAVNWLNGMQDQHSQMYKKAGNNFNAEASGDYTTHAYQVAYNQGNGFTAEPGGFNTLGIQPHYKTRYDFGGVSRNTGDNVNQNWGPDGYYSQITDDRRILGRLDDWAPEQLNSFNEKLRELGYVMDNNYDDKYYRIKPLDGPAKVASPTNPNETVLKEIAAQTKPEDMGGGDTETGDAETERDTVVSTKLKNPFDPTPLIIAGKTVQGLLGNRNIYKNLLEEMPQAPLRDPIDRKLAIVGWQERIKHGQNELADLRRVQQIQQGSDQQANFATALETERVGRDVMDKAFMEDSGRQFETAGKSWNLDNEDYLYNVKVGDDNRRAIADRARMMAQIRAAWRSGDNNILMGAISDTGNWLLKKYQREQDLVDKAKELQLGSPEERAQSELNKDSKYASIMNKYQSGESLTDEERAYVKKAQANALRNIRESYSQAYYNTYHTPWFGGGYKSVLKEKDGAKLEIAKLKARSKDNDRYVSTIKDLRKSTYRRRRR